MRGQGYLSEALQLMSECCKAQLRRVECTCMPCACPNPPSTRCAELEEETVELMRKRVYDMAGILGKTVKVGACRCNRAYEWRKMQPGFLRKARDCRPALLRLAGAPSSNSLCRCTTTARGSSARPSRSMWSCTWALRTAAWHACTSASPTAGRSASPAPRASSTRCVRVQWLTSLLREYLVGLR